jgi:hypothetical protein
MTEKGKTNRFAAVAEKVTKIRTEPEHSPALPPPSPKKGRAPGKSTDPNYVQVTVYLRKSVHAAARKLLIDERRQFSDLVDELVDQWIKDSQKSGSPNV